MKSIIVDWCDPEKRKQYVEQADAAAFDEDGYCVVAAEWLNFGPHLRFGRVEW